MPTVLDTPTIESFGRKFRARETTALDLTEQCLREIDATASRLNAFILVMAEDARRQARQADREFQAGHDRGPLHGVPISVKDLVDIRGTPTTAASRVREGHTAVHDAPIVSRLREAGAVLIGKTNLHEFALGITNEDSAFGAACNPYDLGKSPGGSSGGSAISVATGMALASIGTDTGGSIRIPAAACGIVGSKPAYGHISTDGVVPLSPTLDHVGPLARTVSDAWHLNQVLLGLSNGTSPPFVPVSTLRLAIPRRYFCDVLDPEVRARFEEAVGMLGSAGAQIKDVAISSAAALTAIYWNIQAPEAAVFHAATLERMPERYTVPVRMRLELGRYVLAEDYLRALKGRDVLRQEVDSVLACHDALILPTLPIPAPQIGATSVTIDGVQQPVRGLMLRLTQLFNVTGHPAMSIPYGRTSEGMPCSFQLAGPASQPDRLFGIALACEQLFAQPSEARRPTL